MKTTLKDEIDNFDNSHINNEENIIEPVNYSVDRVTKNVMKAIKAKPKKKKKRWIPILIAAALTTAVIGTTVIASGVLTPFSNKFSGDTSTLKVYSNDSFRFTSKNDELQAEFAGIVGDEDFSLAAIQITRKDGQPIVSGDGVFSGNSELAKSGYKYSVDCDRLSGQDYTPGLPEYYLSKDKKTLTLYLTIKTPLDDMSGTKVSFNSETVYAYTIGKKLSESNVITSSFVADGIEDDSVLHRYEDDKYVEYSISADPFKLPFEVYLELGEKPDASMKKELSFADAPDLLKENETVEMTVSPFKINLTQTKTYTDYQIQRFKDRGSVDEYLLLRDASPFMSYDDCISLLGSGIVMNDGRQFYFVANEEPVTMKHDTESDTWIVNTDLELVFTEYPIDPTTASVYGDSLPRAVVDPSEIGTIVINYSNVYTAPGCNALHLAKPQVLGHVWSPAEIRNLINESEMELSALSVSAGTYDEHFRCITTTADLTAHGSKDDIIFLLRRIERENSHGLFVKSLILAPAGDSIYNIDITMINPYVLESSTESHNDEEILKQFSKYDWVKVCTDYFDSGLMPDASVPFVVNEEHFISEPEEPEQPGYEEPEIPTAVSDPVAEPERTALITPDKSRLTLKVWSDDELNAVLHGESDTTAKEITVKNNYLYTTDKPIVCNSIQLTTEFTKNGLYNFVNEMAAQEENNLFISDIVIDYSQKNNGTYDAVITLLNPCQKDLSPSEVAEEFGYLSRAEYISTLFDRLADWEIDEMTFRLNKEYFAGETPHNAFTAVSIFNRNSSYDDYLELKTVLEEGGLFSLSDELAVSRFEDPETSSSGFYISTYISSDAFSR